jgi:hypothetical protein
MHLGAAFRFTLWNSGFAAVAFGDIPRGKKFDRVERLEGM